MDETTIAQTLHGYEQGHRLLAAGGDVNDEERAILDRLSDLSGYLPTGTSFRQYHTGFPCGRYYAFATTWPDLKAERAGTVLTHTLLVPRDIAAALPDLGSLSPLHRQPASAAEREPYAGPLVLLAASRETLPPAPPAEARRRAAIVLYFGQKNRPALWVEEPSPLPWEIVRYLWWLLWPTARARFAFCTFALGVRQIHRRPFDFLALPPAARGSFYECATSPAWFGEGRLESPQLDAMQAEPWCSELAQEGAAAIERLRDACRHRELPWGEPGVLRALRRYLDLERDAPKRLTAARARADVLQRLWPELPAVHPAWRMALGDLLDRQGEAALDPRPLWELADLLGRPQLAPVVHHDTNLRQTLEQVLERELTERLSARPGVASALVELWGHTRGRPWQGAMLAAVRKAAAALGAARSSALVALCSSTFTSDDAAFGRALFESLDARAREETLRAAYATADAPLRPRLAELGLAVARALGDALLAFVAWDLQGDARVGLGEAEAVVLAQHPPVPERMTPVLGRTTPQLRLAWALEVQETSMARWATQQVAEVAAELPLAELASRAAETPNGARIFLYRLSQSAKILPDELASLLAAHPSLAIALARLHLAPDALPGERMSWSLIRALPRPALLAPQLREAFADLASPWMRDALFDRVGQALLSVLAQGQGRDQGMPVPADAASWITLPSIREWLGDRARYVGSWESALDGQTILHVVACLQSFPDHAMPPPGPWLPALLRLPLEQAERAALEQATEGLVRLLQLPLPVAESAELASSALTAVRRRVPPSGYRFIEWAFPRVYGELTAGRDWRFGSSSWWSDFGWDRARGWRHWLLDTWLAQRWPPVSLLRAVGDDRKLLERLLHRAKKTSAGWMLIGELRRAVAADAELRTLWGTTIEQATSAL